MIDVIIPLYNEEGNLNTLYESLIKELKGIDYKLIFIDDGSIDNSYNVLKKLYDKNKKHIRVIRFSRNFGKDAGIYAGLKEVKSKYVCIIDADMQQHPKYIKEMFNILEDNSDYDEVAMVNNYVNQNIVSKIFHKLFYKIMEKATDQKYVAGASDFRMMRKYVADSILNMMESRRFTKGLFSWVGFNVYYMQYIPDKSKWCI